MTAVLARKYRPQFFRDVVGQDIFVRMIRNALRQGRVGQGFLLTGIRGVGKTTLARLMAKALTCANLQKGEEPCGTCSSCQALVEEKHLDIIEIDAASHTGIDDIRQILDSCSYRAVMGPYKVFIIDEVHMLSKSAFNALLKTLEEPPPHVKFIFATTEIHKVPLTIVSRCQQLHLKRVPPEILVPYLTSICHQEGFTGEEGALTLLARHSEGGVRDALSFLERTFLVAENKVINLSVVQSLLGIPSRQEIEGLLQPILDQNIQAILEKARSFYHGGLEPHSILGELLTLLHDKVVTQLAQEDSKGERNPQEAQVQNSKASDISTPISRWDRMWQLAHRGLAEVEDSPFPLAALEMLLCRMAYMGRFPSPEAVLDMLESRPPLPFSGGSDPTSKKQPRSQAPTPSPSDANYSTNEQERPRSLVSVPLTSSSGSLAQTSESLIREVPKPALPQGGREEDRSVSEYQGSTSPKASPPSDTSNLQPSFEDLVQALKDKREGLLYTHLTCHVAFIAWQANTLTLSWTDSSSPLPSSLTKQLEAFLETWPFQGTCRRYQVMWTDRPQGETFQDKQASIQENRRQQALMHPLLIKTKELFPDFIHEDVAPI